MSTYAARKLLQENIDRHTPVRRDPAAHNLAKALLEITRAIDLLDAKIAHVSQQVANLQRR